MLSDLSTESLKYLLLEQTNAKRHIYHERDLCEACTPVSHAVGLYPVKVALLYRY